MTMKNYGKGVTTMMIVAMEVTRRDAPNTAHLPRFYHTLSSSVVESIFFSLN